LRLRPLKLGVLFNKALIRSSSGFWLSTIDNNVPRYAAVLGCGGVEEGKLKL